MRKALLSILGSILLGIPASAQEGLFINVDPITQTYFLSGSATGEPAFKECDEDIEIEWDNLQPRGLDRVTFLSPEAIAITGAEVRSPWQGFIYAAGNVSGGILFHWDDPTTLTGKPDVLFDYSGWSPTLVDVLEEKARTGEVVGVTCGPPEFALTFRLVAQPLSWSGVLPPINADGSSVFKAGRVVPVKFQLTEESAGITDLEARLYYTQVSDTVAGPVNEAGSPGAADSGNLFRYDLATDEYIFNWSTKGLSAGLYLLELDFGDGYIREVAVGLR